MGAILYGLTYRLVFPPIAAIANLGNIMFPELLKVSPMLLMIAFSLIVLFLFYLIEHGLQRKKKDI